MDLTGMTEKRNRAGTKYFENELGEIVAKECTKCAIVSPLDDYSRAKRGLAGRESKCKRCEARYREVNKEKIKKYYEENREYFLNHARKQWEENRELLIEYNRNYRKENKERIRQYRLENRERDIEQKRRYRKENREYIRERNRVYYQENKDARREYMREHRSKNRELYRLYNNRRRARVSLLQDELTEDNNKYILSNFNNECSLTNDAEIHLDHVIPLNTGHGGTVIGNIIPLRADLNTSKHDRNIFDWFYEEKERFGLSQRRFDELIEYLADINGMSTKEYEEYVRWCHDNPRTPEDIEADIDRYGYNKPSVEIWRDEVAKEKVTA